MGDAVADEQTTSWCNLEFGVVSPLTPHGSERVKASVTDSERDFCFRGSLKGGHP